MKMRVTVNIEKEDNSELTDPTNYALRKKLGLRVSSNLVNDLVVTNRQKHNGMSRSTDGSICLGAFRFPRDH